MGETRRSITMKSIGQLIDELSIVNIRCWYAQEKMMDKSLSVQERVENGELAQKSNAKRSALVSAIDIALSGEESNLGKTYK